MIRVSRSILDQVKRSGAAAPFTVFQANGMLMARPVPVQYIDDGGAPVIAKEGYINLTIMPRLSDSLSSTFDKEKKLSIKLRTRQIGQLIAYKINNPFSLKSPRVIKYWL